MTSDSNFNHAEQPPTRRTRPAGGRMITWVNGVPTPVYTAPLNKQQMSDLITAALSCEYVGDIDEETGEPIGFDARFSGMTNAEVMAIRLAEKAARGHDKSITEVLDRTLGKPKQSVESIGVKMTYRDFLEMLVNEEDAPGGQTIDITPDTDISIFDDDEDDDEDPYACLEGL